MMCYAPRLWYVRKSTDVGHAEVHMSHFVTNRSVRALRNASMLAACRVHIRCGMPWDVPSRRIDINGDLRVWSLWSQISVTKHIDNIFEQILSTWLPPSFLFPQLPSAIQTRNVQRYVQSVIPLNTQCDKRSDAPRIVPIPSCTTDRESMLHTC
jgi:hypothetical protein